MTNKIHSTLQKLKNNSNAREIALLEVVSDIYETAQKTKEDITDAARDSVVTVNNSVHANPWAYMGGAALIGFMVGRLLR